MTSGGIGTDYPTAEHSKLYFQLPIRIKKREQTLKTINDSDYIIVFNLDEFYEYFRHTLRIDNLLSKDEILRNYAQSKSQIQRIEQIYRSRNELKRMLKEKAKKIQN
jgi:hypothetical protein